MAAPAKHIVKLYYDVISPFSYIAFEVLLRYNKRWENMDLKLQPVYIAGIMDAVGNRPPGALPARARYLGQDLNRLSKFYKIPFNLPSDVPKVMFEKGSLPCQRLLVAIARDCPEYLEPVSRQLFSRIWYKDVDAIANESLAEACKDAGMPEDSIAKLVDSLSTPEIKSKLKETTTEAVNDGAFGLPAYVANINDKKILFYGTDRIFLLAHYLGQPWLGCNL